MSDALNALLAQDTNIEKDVFMKRFGVNFRVKGLTQPEYYSLREQASYGTQGETKINDQELEGLLLSTAIIEPNFNDPKVVAKFKAKDGADAAIKSLLMGEVKKLQEAIFTLSGFGEDGEILGSEVEAAKN